MLLAVRLKYSTDKQHFHLTLMMTSAQVDENSVTVTNNSPFQDHPHLDDNTTRSTVTPGFKPFTVVLLYSVLFSVLLEGSLERL